MDRIGPTGETTRWQLAHVVDEQVFGVDKPATTRARKIARDYLGSTFSVEGILQDLPEILPRIRSMAEELVPAFTECLDLDDIERRLMAAWMLSSFGEVIPQFMSKDTYDRACQLLVDAITGDGSAALLATMLLSERGKVPTAVPVLRKLVGENRATSVFAAKALCRWGIVESQMLGVLKDALNGENAILAATGGCALMEIDVARPEAIAKLRTVLPTMEVDGQFTVLTNLKRVRLQSEVLTEAVKEIAASKSGHPAIRRLAASTLGLITHSAEAVEPILLQLLKSKDWQVYGGAMEGLSAINKLPLTLLNRLIELLGDEDANQRVTAAYGVELLGDRAAKAVPVVISRLQEEQNREVADHLVRALVSIGEAAIPELLAAMTETAPKRVDDLMRVVAHLGEPGARALAKLLPSISEERERVTLVMTVGLMGKSAKPAVPILAQILDETTDDELALHVALALTMSGPYALEAIPALIRCLAERGSSDDLVGVWAERALWGLREQATPSLEDAIRGSDGTQRQRLLHTLHMLNSWDDSAYEYLEVLGRDDLLAAFIAIGDALTELGPLSWPKLSEVLESRLKEGRIIGGGFATGNRMINLNTRKLGGLLKCHLTTHGGNQPIGGTLTDAGQRVLRDAKEYMKRKSDKQRRGVKKP